MSSGTVTHSLWRPNLLLCGDTKTRQKTCNTHARRVIQRPDRKPVIHMLEGVIVHEGTVMTPLMQVRTSPVVEINYPVLFVWLLLLLLLVVFVCGVDIFCVFFCMCVSVLIIINLLLIFFYIFKKKLLCDGSSPPPPPPP